MNRASTLISVIMSVYNAEPYLQMAVESVLDQTFADFEFIIIDDGSTDGSLRIIEDYANKDPRIQIIQNAERMRLSKSLNKGLAAARGIYIARMDADDISLPNRLQIQLDYLERHPEIGVVGGQIRFIDEKNQVNREGRLDTSTALVKWDLNFGSALCHPAVMMRKELVTSAGGYSDEMVYAQDYDLWRRLAEITQLTNLPDVVLYYRLHPVNTSSDYVKTQSDYGRRVQEAILSKYFDRGQCQSIAELLDNRKPSEQETEKKVDLLIRLFDAFQQNNTLSASDKSAIRRNLAFRIFHLVKDRKFSWFKVRSLFQSICFAPAIMKSLIRSQIFGG